MSPSVISVIIPVYNVEKYIEKCVKSVIQQDYKGFIEIILIDDCGNDNSFEIINSIRSQNYPNRDFVILKHEQNKGQAAARNYGIRVSKGDYIFFLDSDDFLEYNAISLLYEKIVSTNADFVFGENNTIKDGKIISTTNLCLLNDKPLVKDEILLGIFKKWYPVCWNKLISKDFIIRNNLFFPEGMYYEDLYWAFEVALVGTYFEIVKDVTYNYVIQNSSTTRKLNKRHYNSLVKLVDLFYNKIQKNFILAKENKEKILSIYDNIRWIALDIIFNNYSDFYKKEFFYKIQKQNISSFSSMIFNREMSFKMKLKSLPFYIGKLGYKYLKIKLRIYSQ